MRGSVEPVAVARDVASSSPSKAPSALDMMRYQRISPDCLPLANGGGSSGSRKPTPAAPRSSKDDDAPAVATDSSRLASYLAATSLGPKPRARAPQPPPPAPAPAPPSSSMTRSPARDHSHHYPSSDFPDPTSPSSTGGGPSGSAGHDATMLLQWGQNKRSRGRRDASAVSASASTPSPQRRQAAVKIQHRSSAPAEKLMPPPSYPRGSNLRVSSFLPARGVDAHHGRNAHPHHRSVEERAGGQSSSAAAGAARAEKQQRPGADKADAGAMVTGTQESKHQQGGGGGHQAEHHGPGSSSKAAAAQKQLPRIYTTLSRKEKEDDFLAMKGTKLSQRPKKRPKAVEKAVNFICPGTWLSDVTRSRYEVREKKCTKKQKRRGLKGMEMDSDSD